MQWIIRGNHIYQSSANYKGVVIGHCWELGGSGFNPQTGQTFDPMWCAIRVREEVRLICHEKIIKNVQNKIKIMVGCGWKRLLWNCCKVNTTFIHLIRVRIISSLYKVSFTLLLLPWLGMPCLFFSKILE